MISTPASVIARVVEHLVARGSSAPSAAETPREQDDGALVREALVDEPVRGVVAAALVTGRPSSRRTTVTSVVSRIGTASTSSGRSSVATVEPATFQLDASPSAPSAKPSTWLPLSPMKTAAGAASRRLYGRKPRQAKADAERDAAR